ncbi:5'-nucleotidase [Tamlana sp. 2201CG12-4]|uniref:5'-nucleotidase n=1 Tax=Tamlana sp. 2201CG12-4 TaxID=3112582 RepID=UPI002DBE4FE5|nr:5'-nucleotidase [Tamlana sp. 2201CG12-4]MEC3907677.1 5'-nucleotidase [Tamlana sp. 2201CG12-4]
MLYFLVFFNCKNQKSHLTKIEGSRITINDSLPSSSEIEDFIKPYKAHIDKDLDSVLAYSAETYSKTEGTFNTAIGNLMADIVYEEANPVFKKRTGFDIDMVLLNHGGIRSILPQGNISARTAYQLMPFENSIVVVALKGSQINGLTHYLSQAKRAHPISKLKLIIDDNYDIIEAKIKGKPIDQTKTYYVATNDYLYNGGDNMSFFQPNDSLYVLDYKIRNALIDNFKKVDTLSPVIDDRFIQKNQ